MVNNFDVLKLMSERNMDIRLAPLGNIINVKKVKAGTEITIGVEGDMVGAIAADRFAGGLIFADRKQFNELKSELEKEENAKS